MFHRIFICHETINFFFFFRRLDSANTILSGRATGDQVVGWLGPWAAVSNPDDWNTRKMQCFRSPLVWKCLHFSFLHLFLCFIRPLRTACTPLAPRTQRPPQLSQHRASAIERLSGPCPSPHPACFLHSCSFYSFAQICLCGKFTARTACLNYLKAQDSRLCHKAFPFCVFYFSVWGPFMKSAARRKEIICILGSIHLEFLNFRD